MRTFVKFILVAATVITSNTFAGEDLVLSNRFGEVTAEIFVPGDAAKLRGLLVHAANYKLKPDDRWAEWGRSIGFAHLSIDIDRKANNRPNKLRAAMDQALPVFAKESGHPELPTLPLVGAGHSAGGWITTILLKTPERAIATSINCAWILDPKKLKPEARSVPMMFSLGAVPDGFKMLPDITNNFLPARAEGWPWALGVQWECAHDYGNAAVLDIAWLQAAIDARLADDGKLRALKLEEGWLGDTSSISNQWAGIASWPEFKGDKARASWFPNRSAAYVWRTWQTREPSVVMQARAGDGSVKMSQWGPKKSRDLVLDPNSDVIFSATTPREAALKKVAFFDGDKSLGESTSAPWEVKWNKPTRGAHCVHAMWTAQDGTVGAAPPALIIVRHKESK